jgi:hypothetical protein
MVLVLMGKNRGYSRAVSKRRAEYCAPEIVDLDTVGLYGR